MSVSLSVGRCLGGRCCGRLSGALLGDSSEGEMERLSWKHVHPGGSNGWGRGRTGVRVRG